MVFTTQIWEALGLNRDSIALFWTKWIAFVLALAPMGMDVTKYGIPAKWVPFIQLAALFISVSSAQHRTSDLDPASQKVDVSKTSAAGKAGAIFLAVLIGGGALATTPGCASVQTHVSPVADIANAGGKVEESAHAILEAAISANQTIVNGKPLLARAVLDDVALAVNKIGHAGLDLNAALNAYNAAKAAGSDTSKQAAAVQLALITIQQTLADIGKAIPNGTIAAVDQAAVAILGIIAQVKGVGL